MIASKHKFYVEMQKNVGRMRSIMETGQLLAALPSKICECVRTKDPDLVKFAELFETKLVEQEEEQQKYDKRCKELNEARDKLFLKLPQYEPIEYNLTPEENDRITKVLGGLLKAMSVVQQELTSFRQEHTMKTDIDDFIQHVDDIMIATASLLQTGQQEATTDTH